MTDEPTSAETVRRRGGLWHHLDFRRLWIGETVSQFGTIVSQLALPLVAILVLHATPFQVGLLGTFETLAFLVVGLPGRRLGRPDALPLGAHRQRRDPRRRRSPRSRSPSSSTR